MDETPNTNDNDAISATTRQVLLGLFIIGQLLFLIVGNFLPLIQDKDKQLPGRVQRTMEQMAPGWTKQKGQLWNAGKNAGEIAGLWAGVTGQGQSWQLFAPTIARDIPFPAVEFRWEKPAHEKKLMPHAPEILLSNNEPIDIKRFFRYGQFRIRRLEGLFDLYSTARRDETPTETNQRLSKEIRDFVTTYADRIHAYLRWRANVFRQRNPDLPGAQQVILLLRTYRILPPGDGKQIWSGPYTHTIARWLPQARDDNYYSPIEAYEPVQKKFERVPR